MDQYEVNILTESMAQEICRWRYPEEYSVYNFSEWDVVVSNNWDLAVNEKRESKFIGILLKEELIAFGRIYEDNTIVYLGIGLKPSCCGIGIGKDIMNLLVKEACHRYPGLIIALDVRSYNERAIKCYKKVGFKEKKRYMKDTVDGQTEYIYMEL